MKTHLRVLNVEDSERDAALLQRHLERAGYELTFARVETPAAMRDALEAHEWDIVLTDYTMPQFGALAALALLKETGLDIPFIVISGTVGEELAVEAMLAGANDYLMKDKLARLAPAIERELQEAANRRARRQAEEALRKSEERFRRYFELGLIGMVISSPAKAIVEANDKICEILGYGRDELQRTTWDVLTHPDDLAGDLARFNRVMAGETDSYSLDKRWVRKDGRVVYTTISVRCLRKADGAVDYFVAMVQDITERKTLEEQLRQSQKMEAIGQLAGGLAHDFNNLLTAINGYSELTMMRLKGQDPLRRNLEEIKKAGDRAAALTRQLLAFSRKQVLQPKVIDLNSVVSGLENLLRRLIGEDVDLRTMLNPRLGSVKADPGQIEQVIMNLSVNARDAMPRGGKLTIETENVLLDDEYAKQHISVGPGRYVMLAVSDTGAGMDEETRARIFEPFFTTKESGKGTGLGLSTVYGIVKQSGGSIWVYSEVGRGSTFKIYLPLVDEGGQEYRRSDVVEEAGRGTETVLLAEDEELVRALAREVLEAYGYRVLEAANGGGALLICERHREPIHLLITDVVMPEMSGRELADRLGTLRPEMKVLYMSGYTDNAIVHQGVLDEGTAFIQKPFAPRELARKVRGVLGGGGRKG